MKRPLLSVVVPCYNEAENISLVLERFKKAIEESRHKGRVELILVDNNSKDNSQQILKKELKKHPFARDVFQPIPGYGAAIIKGLSEVKGEFLCWTHGDIQTPPRDTLRGLDILLKQEDPKKAYIKGSRQGRPLLDSFFTFGMSIIETLWFKIFLYDINAQPNLFHRSLLDKMKDPPKDFSFDLYVYYLAKRSGYKVDKFEVNFGKRLHGESTWNTGFKSKIKFIKRTLEFSVKLKRNLKI